MASKKNKLTKIIHDTQEHNQKSLKANVLKLFCKSTNIRKKSSIDPVAKPNTNLTLGKRISHNKCNYFLLKMPVNVTNNRKTFFRIFITLFCKILESCVEPHHWVTFVK